MITSRLGLLLPASLLFISLFPGCKEPNRPHEESVLLAIGLMVHFDDDSVLVELDDELLYRGRVTTNYLLSSAKGFKRTVKTGSHRIKVVHFTYGLEVDTTFNMQDTLYVYIVYDLNDNKLSAYFSNYYFAPH